MLNSYQQVDSNRTKTTPTYVDVVVENMYAKNVEYGAKNRQC